MRSSDNAIRATATANQADRGARRRESARAWRTCELARVIRIMYSQQIVAVYVLCLPLTLNFRHVASTIRTVSVSEHALVDDCPGRGSPIGPSLRLLAAGSGRLSLGAPARLLELANSIGSSSGTLRASLPSFFEDKCK